MEISSAGFNAELKVQHIFLQCNAELKASDSVFRQNSLVRSKPVPAFWERAPDWQSNIFTDLPRALPASFLLQRRCSVWLCYTHLLGCFRFFSQPSLIDCRVIALWGCLTDGVLSPVSVPLHLRVITLVAYSLQLHGPATFYYLPFVTNFVLALLLFFVLPYPLTMTQCS